MKKNGYLSFFFAHKAIGILFLNFRRLQLMAAWKKTNLVVVDAIYDQMYILYFTVVPQWALDGWVPGSWLVGSQGYWLAPRDLVWLLVALVH